jgi:hypothetical protein
VQEIQNFLNLQMSKTHALSLFFFSLQSLGTRLRELELVSSTIDKKLSSQVMRNYHHFVSGLQLITEIGEELKESRMRCTHGRKEMEGVDKALTHSILSTLQKQRSMARCRVVILRLHEVYALLRKENEINALLKQDEFIQSVSIYKSCLSKLATSGLNKFTCLDALRARFLRTGELISNRVKDRLLSLAKHFEADAFRNLLQALVNLGDYKVLSEYLRKYVALAIEENAVEAIMPFLMREYIQSLLSMQVSHSMARAIEAASNPNHPDKFPTGNGIAVVSPNEGKEKEERNPFAVTPSNAAAVGKGEKTDSGVSISLPSTPSSSSSSSLPSSPTPQHISSLLSPATLSPEILASLPKKPFRDLCPHLDRSQFSLAFLTLLSGAVENMRAIAGMKGEIEEVAQEERRKGGGATPTQPLSDGDDPVLTESDSIVIALDSASSFLSTQSSSFFTGIERLVVEFISSQPLSSQHISVEEFVRVLRKGEEFSLTGERFIQSQQSAGSLTVNVQQLNAGPGGSPKEGNGNVSLRSVLHAKSRDYIRFFVRDSLSSLSAAFAQDVWRPLMVEDDFTEERYLKEFRKKEEESRLISASPSSPSFSLSSNPFSIAVAELKAETALRAQEARLAAERKAAAEAARIASSSRPALRAPGSGPVRASALNLSIGRPNFNLPTVGGMTGGVPTVQPRAAMIAAASGGQQQQIAASATPPPHASRPSLSLPAGSSLVPVESSRPFVLSTTLQCAKIFGRYLALLRSFPLHAASAFDGWRDVLDLFCYTLILHFGTGVNGFFQTPHSGGSASVQAANAELRPSLSSSSYLLDAYPTLRSLMTSVKSRVELGVFGGGTGGGPATGATQEAWAREGRQEDVVAAAATLAQVQGNWNEAQNGGSVGGLPQTLAAANQAQAAAAVALLAQTPTTIEKKDGSFFSKLKEKMSAASSSGSDSRRMESAPSTQSNSGQNAVTQALAALTAISSSHPPPHLVSLSPSLLQSLDSPDLMTSLLPRLHAYESLEFMFGVLGRQLGQLEELVPKETEQQRKKFVQYVQYLTSLHIELRSYFEYTLSSLLLPKEVFLAKLNQCRWDMKDLQTKYNAYVDTILNSQCG